MQHPNADKMIEMGNKFLAIHKSEKLTSANLQFDEPGVEKLPVDHPDFTEEGCGTVACHGGWGTVIFGEFTVTYGQYQSFVYGANAIAKFIGFESSIVPSDPSEHRLFEMWAKAHQGLWGNKFGMYMFQSGGHLAFGFDHDSEDKCTLEDIGNHYIAVAKRIRDAEEEHNDGES